jgi:RNA 2',3'-cyclic 3'-phosphodiesterase
MKRLFVAIEVEPNDAFIDFYNALSGSLKHESIKWVEIFNFHITLKFLGETEEDVILAISKELQRISKTFSNFKLNIAKTGIFGSKHDPKVIWLGLESETLNNLGKSVIDGMNKVGFIADRQNFVPHLTLGRIKKLTDNKYFQKMISDNKEKFIQTIYVDKFYLIESVLHKSGPVYNILETYDLKNS